MTKLLLLSLLCYWLFAVLLLLLPITSTLCFTTCTPSTLRSATSWNHPLRSTGSSALPSPSLFTRYCRRHNATAPNSCTTTSGGGGGVAKLSTNSSSAFDLIQYILQKKQIIEKALEEVAPQISTNRRTGRLNEAIRYSLLAPAKRVRPVLCLTACNMLGGKEADCLGAAVALEMVHTMSIMHDDLPALDNDSLRRGRPTNHVVFGEDMAILAGDTLLAKSFEQIIKLTNSQAPPQRILEVIRRFAEAFTLMAQGQAMDLCYSGRADVTLDDLRSIHRNKTGALLKLSVASGAVLAGATKDDVERVERYAENIGLAFQVTDDILDVTQSTAELGKTAGKDSDASKTTYPKLLGLEESQRVAQQLINEAIQVLEPYKERAVPLVAIAKYIVERNS
eukprot:GHVS01069983.1.p1 GENE.GHVS01069983.1~~GHVS01069983.1.p1  ORF type:complete len:394 (+),score=70.16 GHVS01069983.1:197-1378(+)